MGGRRDGGQATVELAFVLPLLVLLCLGIVQVGLLARDRVAVTHAAREAARAAVVEPDDAAARVAAVRGARLRPSQLRVAVSGDRAVGGSATVTVRYLARTDVPIVGLFVPDVTFTERLAFRVG